MMAFQVYYLGGRLSSFIEKNVTLDVQQDFFIHINHGYILCRFINLLVQIKGPIYKKVKSSSRALIMAESQLQQQAYNALASKKFSQLPTGNDMKNVLEMQPFARSPGGGSSQYNQESIYNYPQQQAPVQQQRSGSYPPPQALNLQPAPQQHYQPPMQQNDSYSSQQQYQQQLEDTNSSVRLRQQLSNASMNAGNAKVVITDRDYRNMIREETRRNQIQLAGQYGQMINNKKYIEKESKVSDIQEERERIAKAQKSLELEKVIHQMKRESYKNELDQCLQMKQARVNHGQLINQELVKQDISNIQSYAQKELNNMAAYRNQFVHKDELMRQRQGQYQQQVMSPAMQKDMMLDQVISARNEQYLREQEAKERQERERRHAMTDDRQRSLERQIQEKREKEMASVGVQQREVSERFKAEDEYQNWLKIKKLQRMDQVKEYRQILETQMQLSAVKQETDRRSSMAGAASPLVGIRKPGEVYSSPGGDPSPRNNQPYTLELSPLQNLKASKNPQQVAQSLGVPMEDLYATFDPFKKSSNRLNNKLSSSIQEAAQMQLNMYGNKPQLNYNPIYNPIPLVNQNPYINKGRIDYVPQTKVRGLIINKNGGQNEGMMSNRQQEML
ncbi:hypothetical protein FGO68_gene2685 [Halteria grandinella]|uniref:Uncharacterized protein n=1 Tax=Halteria grandinella TaxID=5974 RepID=A0A8J8NW31_HALGN|nr:hypothetical protein FGO68_gene2685 [Halteria grandinella]